MTIHQLTEIIKIAEKKAIIRQFKELGYTFCNKDRKLGKIDIVELIQAIKCESEDFSDDECRHLFNGRICKAINGYENYEFVLVNVYDIKPSTDPFNNEETAIQTEMLIWAKEIER